MARNSEDFAEPLIQLPAQETCGKRAGSPSWWRTWRAHQWRPALRGKVVMYRRWLMVGWCWLSVGCWLMVVGWWFQMLWLFLEHSATWESWGLNCHGGCELLLTSCNWLVLWLCFTSIFETFHPTCDVWNDECQMLVPECPTISRAKRSEAWVSINWIKLTRTHFLNIYICIYIDYIMHIYIMVNNRLVMKILTWWYVATTSPLVRSWLSAQLWRRWSHQGRARPVPVGCWAAPLFNALRPSRWQSLVQQGYWGHPIQRLCPKKIRGREAHTHTYLGKL